MRENWESVLCDSLEKIQPVGEPRPIDPAAARFAFRGEVVSVQVAVIPPSGIDPVGLPPVVVAVHTGDDAIVSTISTVELVPVEVPAFEGHDDGYLFDKPGLYPDLLRPGASIRPVAGQWRAAWITLQPAPDASAGPVDVRIDLSLADDAPFATHRLRLEVIATELPPLDIVNTHWFHVDGLASFYGTGVFDEEHWAAIGAFLEAAAGMSVNSVLTPVWTPPLDVAPGATRLPAQLIDVEVEEPGRYRFDFAALRRWIELCRRSGMRYLEMPHLFTQWGATAAPAIYARVDGETRQIFGWSTAADAPEYRTFLEQLLPTLLEYLEEAWGLERVLFHISDEPGARTLESYRRARAVVADLLDGVTVIDALSDIEFYLRGLVALPVVATDAAEPFLDAGVDPLWLYYCVGQATDVSNRFIALPSARNRVLGAQLYLAGVRGFLHWGFNFYNAALSTHPIDPFADTCAGGGFLGGDAFIVYPGDRGRPWPSIRYRVFAEAMDDHRAFSLLERLKGRDEARALIDPDGQLSLRAYPSDPGFYHRMRERVARSVRDTLRDARAMRRTSEHGGSGVAET